MKNNTALVSTVKSVVQIVKNLDESRCIYEEGLGLKCIGEADFSANELTAFFGVSEGDFRIARFAREGEEFGCVDLVENPKAERPIRDKTRPFDYGIMTLNFRTNNIEKAVQILKKVGCEPVSEILEYNVGKPMRELMMNTPTGERLTILEVGGANDDLPVFNEAIATVGLVVPRMSEAKRFYEQGLGLQTAIAFQASGAPFDSLLGVRKLDKLDFATLTSDGNWTGKIELLELETGETPVNTNQNCNFSHTGYSHFRFLTDDLEKKAESCCKVGAKANFLSVSSTGIFYDFSKTMLVCYGTEFIEITKRNQEKS
jgi:catechol 2,3-dioxygenase-like lactoylglutathione lyase family enzyme